MIEPMRDAHQSRQPGPRRPAGSPHGPDEVRRAVLDAAAALFAQRGVDAVSLRDIAAAADVHVSLIIRYIGHREELVAEVFRRVSETRRVHPSAVSRGKPPRRRQPGKGRPAERSGAAYLLSDTGDASTDSAAADGVSWEHIAIAGPVVLPSPAAIARRSNSTRRRNGSPCTTTPS